MNKAQILYIKLKDKLKEHQGYLLTTPLSSYSINNKARMTVLEMIKQLDPAWIDEKMGMIGKASLELVQALGRVLYLNMPLILVIIRNPNSISYIDIYRFFKFMNIKTFRFESVKVEAYLSNYVQGLFHKDSLEEYFNSPQRRTARKRAKSVKAPAIEKQGDRSHSLYLQYYQYNFTLKDFIRIMIELVFNVFAKNVQKELMVLKVITKKTEMQENIAKCLDYFIRYCAGKSSKVSYKNPLRYITEEVREVIIKEYAVLIEMFHIVIQKRFKRVAVDTTNPAYLLLIASDDCYLLVNDLGIAKEKFKEIMAIVVYGSEYVKYLNENYELNSKGLLSFFDFVEFLFLFSQYSSPNVFKSIKDKFLHLIKNVLYPALKKKAIT